MLILLHMGFLKVRNNEMLLFYDVVEFSEKFKDFFIGGTSSSNKYEVLLNKVCLKCSILFFRIAWL